jgi:hypothetical protein
MALPTIIPSIFLLFNSLAFLISSIDETPPDIITGQFDVLATLHVSSKLGTLLHPISINISINKPTSTIFINFFQII